jgi:hypothetical protein
MDNYIKDRLTQLFKENLSEEQRAVKILNIYRNAYYQDGNNTERGIIANAIKAILPEYVKQVLEK